MGVDGDSEDLLKLWIERTGNETGYSLQPNLASQEVGVGG